WSRVFSGTAQPKMSFEIAHIDGQIFFYAYVPKKYQKLIEGQIYAQYPEVEVEVVEDYVGQFIEVGRKDRNDRKEEDSKALQMASFDESLSFEKMQAGKVSVAELGLMSPFVWPFKTYDFFVDKEDKTQVDTLSALTSAMSKLNDDTDQAWFQLVIRPINPIWE